MPDKAAELKQVNKECCLAALFSERLRLRSFHPKYATPNRRH